MTQVISIHDRRHVRRAAAAGELTDTQKLRTQAKRMLADPKARRLSTEFFGQWLGFYHFDQYRGVDTGRFPEFTDEVKSAMYDEAISTFEFLGNMGTVSLPLTAALAEEREFLRPGDRVGLLGIGSGLNCMMLGVEW